MSRCVSWRPVAADSPASTFLSSLSDVPLRRQNHARSEPRRIVSEGGINVKFRD